MSLLDAYKNATKDFDAKHDQVSGFEQLPVGEYLVVLNKAEHFVSKHSGWEAMSFDFQVVDGDYAGRHERDMVSLATQFNSGKTVPDFVIARNIRTIAKVAALSDVDLEDSDFDGTETDAYEKLREKFEGKEGATMIMKITESRNKKDPNNPYRNYDYAEAEEERPLPDDENTTTLPKDTTEVDKVDENKLPF